MKFMVREDISSISMEGQCFEVDADGFVEIPDEILDRRDKTAHLPIVEQKEEDENSAQAKKKRGSK